MPGKYQAYPEYKDSGVEWLGEIPCHWSLTKVKYVSTCLDGARIPLNAQERGERQGNIPYWGATRIVDYIAGWLFDEELVLLGEDGAPFFEEYKDVAFNVSGKIWPNNHVHVLRPELSKVEPRFLKHALNRADFHLYISGSTRDKLNQSGMNEIFIRICERSEQQKIANFLDHETAKIDTLIEEQQSLIRLLKEKRQAVISHAVTKGLNPDAPMKDSGVEWLGEVPEHWGVTRAKFVADVFVPQRNKPELNENQDGIAWATMDDMKSSCITMTQLSVSMSAQIDAGSKVLKPGAVIASCVGNFGVASINEIDVIINQQLQAYIPQSISAEYLREVVSLSKVYFELVGTAATLVYVNQQGFEELPVVVPPVSEQLKINAIVLGVKDKYDQLMVLADEQVSILQV